MIAIARTFLAGISLRTWLSIGGALVLLLAGVWLRSHWIGVGEDRVQARWDAQEAAYAVERAEAITAARVLEERHRAELKAVADRFHAEQRKADEEHEADLADLRAGALRLRERFRCPTAPGVPSAAGDPAGTAGAGAGGLQREDQELLLRIGREADEVARRLNALAGACAVR